MARTSRKKKAETAKVCREKVYSAGIYARLSVEGDDRKNESIDNQIEMCRAFVDRNPDMELFECYSDLGKSGTNFERDGFMRMMQDVRKRKIDCVIVKDLSRFGRDHVETGNYLNKIFPFLGVRFIAVTDYFDSKECSADDLKVQLKNLVNEMYTRDISVKIRSSREKQWKSGNFTGRDPAYGYQVERQDGRRILVVDEEAAEVVRRLFKMYLDGVPNPEIIRIFYEEGIHRPSDYRKYHHVYRQEGEELHCWHKASISQILNNCVYIGYLINEQVDGKRIHGRKSFEVINDEWRVVKDNHEPIISEEVFRECARRFEKSAARRRTGEFSNRPKQDDIYRNLIFCGKCGDRYLRADNFSRQSEGYVRNYAYFCRNQNHIDERKCMNDRITKKELDEIVEALLKKEFALSAIKQKNLTAVSEERGEREKAELDKELGKKHREVECLTVSGSDEYLQYRMGEISREIFEARNEERKRKTKKLETEIKKLEKKRKGMDAELEKRKHFLRAVVKGKAEGFLTDEVLHALIMRIEIFPDKQVVIHFKFGRKEFLKMCREE